MDRTTARCPLCEFEGERTDVYQHLQVSHRKSELSRKVLADAEGKPDRIDAVESPSGTAD
jgi:hypothetical protein